MIKLTKWATLLVATSFLAGCQTTGGNPCDGWRAIRPAASDVATLTDGTIRQIVEHNAHGAATCGWKP
ncbi:MAG: hypothetical protein ABJD38_20075 [Aurantimonas coralicida]